MWLHTWQKDPWVKYWGGMSRKDPHDAIGGFHQNEVDFDRSKIVGIWMPVRDRRAMTEAAYSSLIRSMPGHYPFGFIAFDGGSTDGTLEYLQGHVPVFGKHSPKEEFPYSIEGFMTEDCVPNVGVEMWLGKYDPETDKFENEDRIGYICIVHNDMDFVREGWLPKLVELYEQIPDVGILGPLSHEMTGAEVKGKEEEGTLEIDGNVYPFIISVEAIKHSYRKYGYFIDPGFNWIVGWDDLDMHYRFREMGYKTLITHRTFVIHPLGGVRDELAAKDSDWVGAETRNRNLQLSKWGTITPPSQIPIGTHKTPSGNMI